MLDPTRRFEERITRSVFVPVYADDPLGDHGWHMVPQPPKPDGDGEWFVLEDRNRKIVWGRWRT